MKYCVLSEACYDNVNNIIIVVIAYNANITFTISKR